MCLMHLKIDVCYTRAKYVLLQNENTTLQRKHARLTHWGRVTHICVSKQTVIGLDNRLSPGRHQAIIWTNAGTLLIWPLSSRKWRLFCPGLNVINGSKRSKLVLKVLLVESVKTTSMENESRWSRCVVGKKKNTIGDVKIRQIWKLSYHKVLRDM